MNLQPFILATLQLGFQLSLITFQTISTFSTSTNLGPTNLQPLRVSRSPSPPWPKKEVWRGGGGPDGLRGVSPAAVHDGHLGTGRSGRRGAAAEGAAAGPLAADGAVPMPAAGGGGWRLGLGMGVS